MMRPIKNYNGISYYRKFNISEMYEILKYKNYSFIIFKYDSTIDTG